MPDPIFNYVDGGADDEATLRRNTASFERCDLVTNILRGVGELDLSVSVMAQKLAMPVYCSPTATAVVSSRRRKSRRRGSGAIWNDVWSVIARYGEP